MLRKIILAQVLLIMTQSLWAKQLMKVYSAPLSAGGLEFILNTASADQIGVVLIKNKSNSLIMLNRVMRDNPGVSAGWGSQIDSERWSALSWQGQFILSCQLVNQQATQNIPCSKVLQLYQPMAQNKIAQGSYWLVENKTKAFMVRTLLKEMIL